LLVELVRVKWHLATFGFFSELSEFFTGLLIELIGVKVSASGEAGGHTLPSSPGPVGVCDF
jgi:hypothetical protein